MKKAKTIFGLAFLPLFLSPLLLSCGGGGGDASDPMVLRVAVDVDKTETEIVEKWANAFLAREENAGVKIKVVKMTQGYDTYVQKNYGKSTMADIISVYDYNSEYWTSKNILKPITSYMKRDGIEESDYVSSIFSLAKSGQDGDENYYWLPRDYNKVVVCYNKAIFEAAGISKPSDDWTIEDFADVCQKLQDKSDDIKKITGTYDFWPAEMNAKWTAVYYPFIKSYGGDFLADDGTLFRNPDAVKKAVLNLLHYADQPDGTYYKGLGYSNPISDQVTFINKQSAMVFTARPNVKSYASALNNEIDFVSLPKITDNDGKTSYIGTGCSGYGITSGCSDEKAETAWKFLKYIVSKEGQEAFGETGSGIPVLKSLLEEKDAKWRNYISAELNHEAFIKYPERDLSMNYVHGFPIDKQLTVYEELKNNFINSMYNTSDRDMEFNAFKSKIDSTILKK